MIKKRVIYCIITLIINQQLHWIHQIIQKIIINSINQQLVKLGNNYFQLIHIFTQKKEPLTLYKRINKILKTK